jgi:lipopolysaccharide export system protein LptA
LNQETQQFLYQDNVHLKTSQGFDFTTKRALVDLKTQTVTSSDPLEGTAPFGTLASQKGFEASKKTQTLAFKGPTTLVMEPKVFVSDKFVKNSNNPLTIFSPTGIVCAHQDQTCTATGPVTATKEAMTLRCQRLVLTMKNGANSLKNRIDKIEAFTHVVLTDSKEGLTATGNHALYDPQHEHIYLEGNPVLTDKEMVLKGCATIIFKKNDGVALTKGRGTMIYKDKLLQADTFTVYVKTSVEGKITLDRVKAEGHVILSTAQEIAKSDTGLYQVGLQLVELFGHVSLTRPEGQLQGTYARYDMVTGQSQLFNKTPAGKNTRVQGILMPKQVKKNGS